VDIDKNAANKRIKKDTNSWMMLWTQHSTSVPCWNNSICSKRNIPKCTLYQIFKILICGKCNKQRSMGRRQTRVLQKVLKIRQKNMNLTENDFLFWECCTFL
jgi:hypothetical protein